MPGLSEVADNARSVSIMRPACAGLWAWPRAGRLPCWSRPTGSARAWTCLAGMPSSWDMSWQLWCAAQAAQHAQLHTTPQELT